MPIYEFYCPKCKQDFEILISLNKTNTVCCEICGNPNVQKKVSSFGIGGGTNRIKSTKSCVGCTANTCSTCK